MSEHVCIADTNDRNSLELAQSIQALNLTQITDDYQQIVLKLAGPLYALVRAVFPSHLQLTYLVTDSRRRQIWNAYLAAPAISQTLEKDSCEACVAVRRALLCERSEDLIKEAYGAVYPGLLSIFAKLGTDGMAPEIYRDLYRLISADCRLRKVLMHEDRITPHLVESLSLLPTAFRSLRFAKTFDSKGEVHAFIAMISRLQELQFLEKEHLIGRLSRHAKNGLPVKSILEQIYLAIPFPDPIVPDDDKLRHLRNGRELKAAAKKYNNCLAGLVRWALRDDRQFYEWLGDARAIIELRRHHSGNWFVDEIRLKENAYPTPDMEKEIVAHFKAAGVTGEPGVAQLVERFMRAAEHEFVDDDLEMLEFDTLEDLFRETA